MYSKPLIICHRKNTIKQFKKIVGDLKIVVLISGKGSNLKAIAKECSKKNVPARIISIISNNPNASGLQIKGKFKKKVINDKLYDKNDNKLNI